MNTDHRKKKLSSDGLSRRQLLQVAGGATLAVGTGALGESFGYDINQWFYDPAEAGTNNDNTLICSRIQYYTGVVNVKCWGAVGDGATDDTAAIQAAIDSVSGGGKVTLAGGNYATTGTLILGYNTKLIGEGGSIIKSTAGPIIKCSSSRWVITGMLLKYSFLQSDTTSYGIQLESAFESIIENVEIQNAYIGVGVNTDAFDNTTYAYMMLIKNTRSYNAASWGFYFQNDGSVGMTTNSFEGCYVVQEAKNNSNTASRGFFIGNHQGGATLLDCGVDKIQGGYALLVQSSNNVTTKALDIESNVASDAKVVSISSCTNISIEVQFEANTFNGTTNYCAYVSGDCKNIKITGREKNSIDTARSTYGIGASVTNEDCMVDAHGFYSDTSFLREDVLTPNGKRIIFSYAGNIYAKLIGINNRVEYRTARPLTGTWDVGDRVVNTDVTDASPINEWACTVAGTPGSWRVVSSGTVKGPTGSRPSGLSTSEFGVRYLDTTLAANGKPITWNGFLWVDSDGVSV